MRRFCPGSLMVYVTVAWLQSLRGWLCQLCTCYICKKVDIKQYKWLNFILKEKLHIYRLWIYSDLRHPAANSNGETCFLIEADCMTFWSLFHFKWLLYICVTGSHLVCILIWNIRVQIDQVTICLMLGCSRLHHCSTTQLSAKRISKRKEQRQGKILEKILTCKSSM